MQIPDLLMKGGASFFLEKIAWNRQANDDEETQKGLFDATIDLTMSLKDQVVDSHPSYLRGAAESIVAAADGKGTTVVRYEPLDVERNVRLTVGRGDKWVAFTNAGAEIRVLQVTATAESPRFQVKAKVTGLDSSQAGDLLECWKKGVTVQFDPVQTSLMAA